MTWISTDKALPPRGMRVLVARKQIKGWRIVIEARGINAWYDPDTSECSSYSVPEYWRDLPIDPEK